MARPRRLTKGGRERLEQKEKSAYKHVWQKENEEKKRDKKRDRQDLKNYMVENQSNSRWVNNVVIILTFKKIKIYCITERGPIMILIHICI